METGKPEIISEDKQIERLLSNAFGGPPLIFRVSHNTRKYEISTLVVPGRPEPELCSLATIGLWRTPLTGPNATETSRLELTSLFEVSREGAREVLAAAAFKIMRTHKFVSAGTVFMNCLHDWYPKSTVPHIYFVDANFWSFPNLQPIRMGALHIQFLQTIPITESECQFVQEHGSPALESRLLGSSTNIWDLKRAPCI